MMKYHTSRELFSKKRLITKSRLFRLEVTAGLYRSISGEMRAVAGYWSHWWVCVPAGPARRSPCGSGTCTGSRFRCPRARRWWRTRWRTAVPSRAHGWRSSPSKPSRICGPRTEPSEPPPHAEEPTPNHYNERLRAPKTPRATRDTWLTPATQHRGYMTRVTVNTDESYDRRITVNTDDSYDNCEHWWFIWPQSHCEHWTLMIRFTKESLFEHRTKWFIWSRVTDHKHRPRFIWFY